MSNSRVIPLEDYRAATQNPVTPKPEERVWDRIQRLSQKASDPFQSSKDRTCALTDAINAMVQYISNELPIEKHNKVRADQVAERAATLFVKAIINPATSAHAIYLQDAVLKTFEDKPEYVQALENYRATIDNIQKAMMHNQAIEPH